VRNGRLAQRILSLAVSSERAAAIVGDLVETAPHRGRAWFWTSLVRLVAASLTEAVRQAPLRFVGWAAISWFVYGVVSLVLTGVGLAASFPLWGIASVLSNHTGVELMTDWLGVRIDWGVPAPGLMRAIELVMLAAAAPFLTGRLAACWWPQRELAAALVMSAIWPLMALLVPLVGFRAGATIDLVPVMVTCMLLGAVWSRVRQPSPPRLS
jgi:hypothetical protein